MELLALVEHIRRSLSARDVSIRSLCESADEDGNGYLTQSEIETILQQLDESLPSNKLRDLITLMDVDGDNAIEYMEFEMMFEKSQSIQATASQLRQISGPVSTAAQLRSRSTGIVGTVSQEKRQRIIQTRQRQNRDTNTSGESKVPDAPQATTTSSLAALRAEQALLAA